MTALIEMARKCGAHVMPVNIPTPEQAAEFAAMFPTQAALAAFTEAVRQEERERAAEICSAQARQTNEVAETLTTCVKSVVLAAAYSLEQCAAAILSQNGPEALK